MSAAVTRPAGVSRQQCMPLLGTTTGVYGVERLPIRFEAAKGAVATLGQAARGTYLGAPSC